MEMNVKNNHAMRIAILGRPNVGKSTLFNRICGKKLATTHNLPGITRDFKEHLGHIGDLVFTVIDTAGWDNVNTYTDSRFTQNDIKPNINIYRENSNAKIYECSAKTIDYISHNNSSNLESIKILKTAMTNSTLIAAKRANIILFMLDSTSNITSADLDFTEILRKLNKPVLIILNKSDSNAVITIDQIHRLGFGDPIYISSTHGYGFADLYHAILKKLHDFHRHDTKLKLNQEIEKNLNGIDSILSRANSLPNREIKFEKLSATTATTAATTTILPIPVPFVSKKTKFDKRNNINNITILTNTNTTNTPITNTPNVSITITGRPNVGKSTLFNRIVGYERAITSAISGTTRDCIRHSITFDSRNIDFIDSAGMRKKQKIMEEVEYYAVGQSITAIKISDVVVLVMDSLQPFESQDIAIAKVAINEGKGLLIVVNKFDLIEERKAFIQEINYKLNYHLTDLSNTKVLYISAIESPDFIVNQIIRNAVKISDCTRKKINTAELNIWLKKATAKHSIPRISANRVVKIKYITQTAIKPQTFSLFTNISADIADKVPQSYIRYLTNSIASAFHLDSIPIRLKLNASSNPYIGQRSSFKHSSR